MNHVATSFQLSTYSLSTQVRLRGTLSRWLAVATLGLLVPFLSARADSRLGNLSNRILIGYGQSITAGLTIGGSGTEILTGGAGDDVITAGSGKDTITGGKGDDLLTAGTGKDTFMYSGNFGNDTIDSFNHNKDIIHFAANDFASYTALESHMVQDGADVVITLDATDSIVLTNQTLANLTSSDFTFG